MDDEVVKPLERWLGSLRALQVRDSLSVHVHTINHTVSCSQNSSNFHWEVARHFATPPQTEPLPTLMRLPPDIAQA